MKKIISLAILSLFFANGAFASDINVYYFWSNPRCMTCKKMEAYTQNAVKKMNDSSVHFSLVNMSKNKNNVKKYKLYTKSVVISKTENGKEKWKNLDKIWSKVGNEKEFENYVISEIKKLQGAK